MDRDVPRNKLSSMNSQAFGAELDVMLEPYAEKLNDTTRRVKKIAETVGCFDTMLLYGQPGSGKTKALLAARMEQDCGFECIHLASDVSGGRSPHEVNALLAWLSRFIDTSSKKTMIIIDEAKSYC